ncbi:MAG: cation:proton antiporter [Rhodovibrionaceae bacterium]
MEGLHDHSQLTGIALVALAALACGMLMSRLRQPPVVGYILAGVILGPSALGLVENREAIQLLAELGVLMLLFLIGMELSLRGFKEVWKVALATVAAQIAVSVAAMFGLSLLTGWSLEFAILLGFVIALSSTAVAIKMLEEIGELRTRVGQITVGVLIAQDLAVVPMMLIVSAMGQNANAAQEVNPWEAGATVAVSVVVLVALILYLSRRKRITLPFANLVGSHADLTPLAGLAFCFGAATLSGFLGLSPAYGAFIAGLVIGNSTGRATMLRHSAPIQAVLLMVFFLSIGLLMDLGFIWENLWAVLFILFVVMGLKTLLNVGAIRFTGETWPRALIAGASLAQLGEFAFILAAVGGSVGIVSLEDNRLIVSITALTLVIAPLWLEAARRLHRIGLLGITSWRETLRLAFGVESKNFTRWRTRADHTMVEMASSATRWVGEIRPRSNRGAERPVDEGRPPRRRS